MNSIPSTSAGAVSSLVRLPKTTILWLLLAAFGAYAGLKTAMGLYGPDADTSHSLLMWYGVKQGGLSWLKDWLFTPDNWLLSLVPIDFLAFLVLGPSFSVTILMGWVFFIGSALTAGAIAWSAGARKVALPITAILLNLTVYAHDQGCASFSTSHNITNLFGLLALLCAIHWLKSGKIVMAAAIAILLFCGTISDPWMLASYDIPLAMACVAALFWPPLKSASNRVLVSLGCVIVAVILARTQVFGLLSFLPKFGIQFGDWQTIYSNLQFAVVDIGRLVNLEPFEMKIVAIMAIMSLFLLYICFHLVVLDLIRLKTSLPPLQVFVCATATLSVLGAAGALIILNTQAYEGSARFLINAPYGIVVVLGMLAGVSWPALSKAAKSACKIAMAGFVLTATVSTAPYWTELRVHFKDTGVTDLVKYLDANSLTYGYGPYWGAKGNAVTIGTKTRIRLRPVVFDKATGLMITGNRPQTSTRWYGPGDAPAGTQAWFVVVQSDGEECPNVQICIDGLTKQFGPPAQTLTHGPQTLLVWKHPLIGYEPPPIPVSLGRPVVFKQDGADIGSIGWWTPGGSGTYTNSPSASLRLKLNGPVTAEVPMAIQAAAFLGGALKTQSVDVLVNGHLIGTLKFDMTNNGGVRVLRIPSALIGPDHVLTVEFHVAALHSPMDLGVSSDGRKLGLLLTSLTLG